MLRFLLVAMAVALVGACASQSGPAQYDQLQIPDKTSLVTSGDLRIKPMDLLSIKVFGVPELDGEYQVDFEGRVKMPLAGEVVAKGYSAFEFSKRLEQALGERYLENPDVNVVIQESVGREVTVEGSVNKPGMYPVRGELSLLQAVALAGGPSDTANSRKVVVFRTTNGQRTAAGFDLRKIRRGDTEDPIIYGNDIVVVDGSEARRTYGDIIRSVPLLALFLIY